MRKQTVKRVFVTTIAVPFIVSALVLFVLGILLKAAGRLCALDIAGARREIHQIKSI